MGKARRIRKENRKKASENEPQSIYKDEEEEKKYEKKKEKLEKNIADKIKLEMERLGLPTDFASTKGQHIDGQPNVEACRVGSIRRYQQFQRKKLKQWQIQRLRGTKQKQRRMTAKVVNY